MYEAIVRQLTERGVRFRIHRHPVAATVAEAQARLPFPPEQFLKTLAFKVRDGGWVLAALRGLDRIDYRKLAEAVVVKRAELRQPGPEEVQAELGFAVGGVCPFPPTPDTVVIVDRDAARLDVVYCGIAREDSTLEIGLRDLLALTNARVQAIAQSRPE